MFQKVTKFLRDVNNEMAKVSWPSRNELKGQTIIVIVVSLFFAVFIFGVDHLLSRVISLIY
ncbi:preprotein translocase subunit SecE [candidate division KSB1 bacterium RBG_16_48_16]|nr:MAG: preprotein translocase subunit SecE [candidate division KSB1 bacterium RBG_16_48_16]